MKNMGATPAKLRNPSPMKLFKSVAFHTLESDHKGMSKAKLLKELRDLQALNDYSGEASVRNQRTDPAIAALCQEYLDGSGAVIVNGSSGKLMPPPLFCLCLRACMRMWASLV